MCESVLIENAIKSTINALYERERVRTTKSHWHKFVPSHEWYTLCVCCIQYIRKQSSSRDNSQIKIYQKHIRVYAANKQTIRFSRPTDRPNRPKSYRSLRLRVLLFAAVTAPVAALCFVLVYSFTYQKSHNWIQSFADSDCSSTWLLWVIIQFFFSFWLNSQ